MSNKRTVFYLLIEKQNDKSYTHKLWMMWNCKTVWILPFVNLHRLQTTMSRRCYRTLECLTRFHKTSPLNYRGRFRYHQITLNNHYCSCKKNIIQNMNKYGTTLLSDVMYVSEATHRVMMCGPVGLESWQIVPPLNEWVGLPARSIIGVQRRFRTTVFFSRY